MGLWWSLLRTAGFVLGYVKGWRLAISTDFGDSLREMGIWVWICTYTYQSDLEKDEVAHCHVVEQRVVYRGGPVLIDQCVDGADGVFHFRFVHVALHRADELGDFQFHKDGKRGVSHALRLASVGLCGKVHVFQPDLPTAKS